MKAFFQLLIFCCLVKLLSTSCANQQRPEGGPKDTIPPTLVSAYPPHQSTNVSVTKFSFELDERINVEKLKKELIIVPSTENKFKVNYKKYSFDLVFENSFDSATTYTFNFGDGVADVTEKNPVKNFKYVFSTGNELDSLSVSGIVTVATTGLAVENALVILQRPQDTSNVFDNKPYYFSYTDEKGHFLIENIRNNDYRLYAYLDEDKNLTCKPETEPLAFCDTVLSLNDNLDSIALQLVTQDNKKLSFLRAGKKGKNFIISYNKQLKEYNILNDTLNTFLSHLNKERNGIIFYNTIDLKDSLACHVSAMDSLGNQTIDTVAIQFDLDNNRKLLPFDLKIHNQDPLGFIDTLSLEIHTSKPIVTFQPDSITLNYDSIYTQPIPKEAFIMNANKTRVSLRIPVDIDSIKALIDTLKFMNKLDTLITSEDSLKHEKYKTLTKLKADKINLTVKPNSFISVTNDSSAFTTQTYNRTDVSELGKISGSIITKEPYFILQFISDKGLIFKELYSSKSFDVDHVPPGEYHLRVVKDLNNNKLWDKGNIHKWQLPEPIINLKDKISMRANWELQDVEISF